MAPDETGRFPFRGTIGCVPIRWPFDSPRGEVALDGNDRYPLIVDDLGVLDELNLTKLEARCRTVPMTENEYVATDFVAALLGTVMDYQNSTTTVERAGKYFEAHAWDEIRTLDDLEGALTRFPADKDGNDELAQYLWGYHHWRRAQELRGLVVYFRERDVADLDSLRAWATASTEKDFVGHIKGLGPTVYQGLVMRVGVETVKPDVHILRFVGAAIGRPVNERDAVSGLEEVAGRLGVSPRTLDWSIWEYQRTLPSGTRYVGHGAESRRQPVR